MGVFDAWMEQDPAPGERARQITKEAVAESLRGTSDEHLLTVVTIMEMIQIPDAQQLADQLGCPSHHLMEHMLRTGAVGVVAHMIQVELDRRQAEAVRPTQEEIEHQEWLTRCEARTAERQAQHESRLAPNAEKLAKLQSRGWFDGEHAIAGLGKTRPKSDRSRKLAESFAPGHAMTAPLDYRRSKINGEDDEVSMSLYLEGVYDAMLPLSDDFVALLGHEPQDDIERRAHVLYVGNLLDTAVVQTSYINATVDAAPPMKAETIRKVREVFASASK